MKIKKEKICPPEKLSFTPTSTHVQWPCVPFLIHIFIFCICVWRQSKDTRRCQIHGIGESFWISHIIETVTETGISHFW